MNPIKRCCFRVRFSLGVAWPSVKSFFDPPFLFPQHVRTTPHFPSIVTRQPSIWTIWTQVTYLQVTIIHYCPSDIFPPLQIVTSPAWMSTSSLPVLHWSTCIHNRVACLQLTVNPMFFPHKGLSPTTHALHTFGLQSIKVCNKEWRTI